MTPPRMVATDLDGTLLDPHDRISRRTAAAIRRVQDAGAVFVVVSGRPHRWLRSTVSWGLTGTAICANGAITFDIDADEILESTLIDHVTASEVAGVIKQRFPDWRLGVERALDCALTHADSKPCALDVTGYPFLAETGFATPWSDGDFSVVTESELFIHPPVKMLLRDAAMESDAMAEAARATLGDRVEVAVSSYGGIIELLPLGVTKAAALARFALAKGIHPTEVVAFGDMWNDIPMMEWSGYSVAMAQAPAGVKQVADEITTSNADDGVAVVLERWFRERMSLF